MKLFRIFFFLLTLCSCGQESSPPQKKIRIGLCCVATGGYDVYAKEMISSARQFFLKNCDVTFFLFTDQLYEPSLGSDVIVLPQTHLGWPEATLRRFHVYLKNKEKFRDCDYLFAIDADMRFVAPVNEEILGKTVGVSRDVGKHVTYEGNKKSKAYVHRGKAKHYFAGAFYGGKRDCFLKMVKTMAKNIDRDLNWGYIAAWHDESHLNRYFFDHPPAICLNTSYCYFENWELPYSPKIVAIVDKKIKKEKKEEAP